MFQRSMKTCIQLSCVALLGASASALAADMHKPANTCTGTYPSYWQDIAPKFADMWKGQTISNAPTGAYSGPIFKLSDDYPRQPVDDKAHQPWRSSKFDALFDPATKPKVKEKLAKEYGWLVYQYILAGNINRSGQTDFDVCENPVRPWYHIAFQTYDPLSGREFIHGLTREAPVTFSIKSGTGTAATTMWAVAIYNATAAYTLGTVWQKDGTAKIPTANIRFDEGAVIGKPLFNTATLDQLPVLANMPRWNANISDPTFCQTPENATMAEQSNLCPRNYAKWNDVRLMQFDISVADHRAKSTGWVYGTFVADGQRKAKVKDQWQRVSLLGLMWGNDTPPAGQLAYNYPPNPRKNGFKQEVIFWDVVDELNSYGGTGTVQRMGHLGSNHRLNGPADNANSSCMSCHGTASVPDKTFTTPPLLAQFSAMTKQSVAPVNGLTDVGLDRSGTPATQQNGVTFSEMDAIYFANVMAGTSFNMTTPGGKNVMGEGVPAYPNPAQKQWIALDYSLQLSMSLKQWMQWQADQAAQTPSENRKFVKPLRRVQ
ncbi:hypothetical protein KIK84_07425 [Curvibacter sp. CHRR-16]|uniref:hypothetical protein n=1 Tax=Curvibacter sp. CHRR-16 TaxID=2835872 RepID=UPI001BD9B721|nr:hypothetical protein [Curvibacter sp. CHRR-16]MBT0570150.1 hypothetical protein [Curvibacter sp. CHRR-16]